jgi:SAM-dependent methyltransferase
MGDLYAEWARVYDCYYPDRTSEVQFWDALAAQHGPRVLDLMCGTAEVSLELARRGYRVLGVDLSPAMLSVAAQRVAAAADYLAFLETIHARWQALPGASAEVIPNVHPERRTATYPDHPVGRAGWHQADTACPIGPATWDSAYWSAQTALSAVDLVLGDLADVEEPGCLIIVVVRFLFHPHAGRRAKRSEGAHRVHFFEQVGIHQFHAQPSAGTQHASQLAQGGARVWFVQMIEGAVATNQRKVEGATGSG